MLFFNQKPVFGVFFVHSGQLEVIYDSKATNMEGSELSEGVISASHWSPGIHMYMTPSCRAKHFL